MAFPDMKRIARFGSLPGRVAPLLRLWGYGRLFLPLVGMAYAAGILSYLFVWLVDPFSLRSGGASVRLLDRPYADEFIRRIVSVAAHDGADLIVLGGSTTMAFTPAMLREAFPEARHPVNLSVVGLSAGELRALMRRIETSKTVKRVIVTLDFSLIAGLAWFPQTQALRYYEPPWHDPVPEFEMGAIPSAIQVLRTGVLDNKKWRRFNEERPDFMRYAVVAGTYEPSLTKLKQGVETSRAWVTTGMPDKPCGSMTAIRDVVMPFSKRMVARGIAVDLFLPPYSLAVYSDWTANFPDGYFFSGKGAVWSNLISLRWCAVQAADGIPNLRVHGFDTDFALTGDLKRYLDSSHIVDLDTYRQLLKRVARGDFVLTAAAWPAYEAALKKAVQSFSP